MFLFTRILRQAGVAPVLSRDTHEKQGMQWSHLNSVDTCRRVFFLLFNFSIELLRYTTWLKMNKIIIVV